MKLFPRLLAGDTELGKRDDDHRLGSSRRFAVPWSHRPYHLRRNLKKMLIALALLFILYHFVKNIPTDLGPLTARPDYDHETTAKKKTWTGPKSGVNNHSTGSASSKPEEQENTGANERHSFNGPIKFYNLAISLHAIASTKGLKLNKNVLFSASSVKSASILIPLACEMAALKRNHVHFSFVGRNDISIDILKEVNGAKDCEVWFHDSRPDFLLESSDYRMEVSASAGLGHIYSYMNPQAIIVDGSGLEDAFFLEGFRRRTTLLSRTLIQIPANSEQNLRWMTRLDSSSLSKWNEVSIDVVVHAQPAASGSLIRLLGSLSKADYFQSATPRLTIELPNEVDEPTTKFLETYRWPPPKVSILTNQNQLSLRHRISQSGLMPEENAVRFLESFWPQKAAMSHVLILSPQVELSPLYYHYLKYLILEYKCSEMWANERHLLGISLDLPSKHINGSTAFSPPKLPSSATSKPEVSSLFLWQAPNSNAALYFGDKWTELHSFIGQSLLSQRRVPKPKTLGTKEVSKAYPSWLEYILSLSRTRGYDMLYSTLPDSVALATIHNELYHPPEEFSSSSDAQEDLALENDAELTADFSHHSPAHQDERSLAKSFLLNILPHEGALPSLGSLPLLRWDGAPISRIKMEEMAVNYSRIFIREVGGCINENTLQRRLNGRADDLFCLDVEADNSSHSAATE